MYYLSCDLHSLFRLHPLFNIDAIRQWIVIRSNLTLSSHQWSRILTTASHLGLTAHFSINTKIPQQEAFMLNLFPNATTMKSGYCVYSQLRGFSIRIGSQLRKRVMDNQEVVNLGFPLRAYTKSSLELIYRLADLEECWYSIPQLQEMGHTELSMRRIRTAMNRMERMELEYNRAEENHSYPGILQWKMEKGIFYFSLPHTTFMISLVKQRGRVMTTDFPPIRYPSSNLPGREALDTMGLSIRIEGE